MKRTTRTVLAALASAAPLVAIGDAGAAPPAFLGWMEVPGNGSSQLAPAAATLGNALYLFTVGATDHTVDVNRFDGTTWSGWRGLAGATATTAAPLAVSFYQRLYVFDVGNADHVPRMNVLDGMAWSGWSKVAASPTGTTIKTVAVTTHEGRVHLFGTGDDGRVYDDLYDGNTWTGWKGLPDPLSTATAPAVYSAADYRGRLYLFRTGAADHKRSVASQAGGAWVTWQPVPDGPPSAVADAAVAAGGQLSLFAVGGADHKHQVSLFDGSSWTGWSPLAGDATTLVSDAAAVFSGKLHLFSVATNGHVFDDVLPGLPAAAPLRFDQIQAKGSHNSYESNDGRVQSIFDQLAYHHVRSLEIDIHRYHAISTADWTAAGMAAMAAVVAPGTATTIWKKLLHPSDGTEFDVFHEFDADHGPTCTTLSACLREVRAFHDLLPNHEVVSVWLEYKDTDWVTGHMPADLDADIAAAFDDKTVYTPAEMLGSCKGQKSLQGVVRQCGWPIASTLQGRVLFVLMQTTDAACTPNLPKDSCEATAKTIFDYAPTDADAAVRTAFVAPNYAGLSKSQAIFVNVNKLDLGKLQASACAAFPPPAGCAPGVVSPRVTLANVIVRNTGDTQSEWDTNRDDGFQVIGTEHTNIDRDVQFDVRGRLGWPFAPREPNEHPETMFQPDDEAVVRLATTSGDINGTEDSFAFAYVTNTSATSTWRAGVAGAGDNVNEWAKGCLMARETTQPNSSYFAVCRPEGSHPLRVQYRDATHASAATPELKRQPLNHASVLFLDVSQGANSQYCYRGRVADTANATTGGGANVETSATVCFPTQLTLQGLAVSSHGDASVKYLFAGLTRSDGGAAAATLTAKSFTNITAVGTGVTSLDFGNGTFPIPKPPL